MKNINLIIGILLLAMNTIQSRGQQIVTGQVTDAIHGYALAGVQVNLKGDAAKITTDMQGNFRIELPDLKGILVFTQVGYIQQEVALKGRNHLNVSLKDNHQILQEVEIIHQPNELRKMRMDAVTGIAMEPGRVQSDYYYDPVPHNTDEYDVINDNTFHKVLHHPLSTFSIDVDAASYSHMRASIQNGRMPHVDQVRIEEMINYFEYDYAAPKGEHPFSINTEVGVAPWNPKHQLVHVGLQGVKMDFEQMAPSNLVFLIDVSGSMSPANRLPLVISSMKLMVNNLQAHDRVAIVVYAGAAGLVLPSTPASDKQTILNALNRLQAGGSTAGGAGIQLAYDVAKQNYLPHGNNRVILCTDGDFNVGASSTAEMVRLVEERSKENVYLTIAGFGMGNYKDGRMEQMTNAGNGNYYYIDNIREAEKVFVKELRGTLYTIAQDVKIQVEFNPVFVQAYRLIGYENRMLKSEDFNNDKKDAGELGVGHTVTALYELIPVGVDSEFIGRVDSLKYQENMTHGVKQTGQELFTVKFRYKRPGETKSRLITHVQKKGAVPQGKESINFRWSAAVAQFGMILRNSEFKGQSSYQQVLSLASEAMSTDEMGYRAEFIQLVQSVQLMASN